MRQAVLVFLIAAVIAAAGCTSYDAGDSMMEKNATVVEKNASAMEGKGMMEVTAMEETGFSGTILAGSSSKLIDFNKADYDAALASDKVVFLYFYADWCPTCRAEVPQMYAAFDELTTDRLVGFRVNFKDSGTDDSEKALAEQFQVPYQHYKIILKDDKLALKAPDTWNKDRYVAELNKFAA